MPTANLASIIKSSENYEDAAKKLMALESPGAPDDNQHEGASLSDLVSAANKKTMHAEDILDRKSDRKLKKETLEKLFYFLGAETAAIFLIFFFQGFGACSGFFKLTDLTLQILSTATIVQIATMLLVAVNSLFPKKNGCSQCGRCKKCQRR